MDAIVVVAREGRYRYTNPAHEHLTGYTAAEVVGQACVDYFTRTIDIYSGSLMTQAQALR